MSVMRRTPKSGTLPVSSASPFQITCVKWPRIVPVLPPAVNDVGTKPTQPMMSYSAPEPEPTIGGR